MANVDEQFVDYDFSTDPNFVFGMMPESATQEELCASFGDIEEVEPNLTRAEIIEACEKMAAEKSGAEWLVSRIYNQGREGSCVANATCQAHEIVQAMQYGKPNVIHLSAMSVYRFIGSGPSSGAMVSDGLRQLQNVGAVPLDTPENRAKFGSVVMENTGWNQRFPEGWKEVAGKIRSVEAKVIRSYDALLSACARRRPVVVGRSGHSICYAGLLYENGRFRAPYPNSWGSWGSPFGEHPSGWGFDSESYIKSSAGWAFALCSVTH